MANLFSTKFSPKNEIYLNILRQNLVLFEELANPICAEQNGGIRLMPEMNTLKSLDTQTSNKRGHTAHVALVKQTTPTHPGDSRHRVPGASANNLRDTALRHCQGALRKKFLHEFDVRQWIPLQTFMPFPEPRLFHRSGIADNVDNHFVLQFVG